MSCFNHSYVGFFRKQKNSVCFHFGGNGRGVGGGHVVVNYHKVTLEEAGLEPQPKSQW